MSKLYGTFPDDLPQLTALYTELVGKLVWPTIDRARYTRWQLHLKTDEHVVHEGNELMLEVGNIMRDTVDLPGLNLSFVITETGKSPNDPISARDQGYLFQKMEERSEIFTGMTRAQVLGQWFNLKMQHQILKGLWPTMMGRVQARSIVLRHYDGYFYAASRTRLGESLFENSSRGSFSL